MTINRKPKKGLTNHQKQMTKNAFAYFEKQASDPAHGDIIADLIWKSIIDKYTVDDQYK